VRAHTDVQPSLRDATRGWVPAPWVETHGYRHFVAPRRRRAPQTQRKMSKLRNAELQLRAIPAPNGRSPTCPDRWTATARNG